MLLCTVALVTFCTYYWWDRVISSIRYCCDGVRPRVVLTKQFGGSVFCAVYVLWSDWVYTVNECTVLIECTLWLVCQSFHWHFHLWCRCILPAVMSLRVTFAKCQCELDTSALSETGVVVSQLIVGSHQPDANNGAASTSVSHWTAAAVATNVVFQLRVWQL